MGAAMVLVRVCEDCNCTMPDDERRVRCPHCKLLVCGWCFHHVHDHPANVAARTSEGKL